MVFQTVNERILQELAPQVPAAVARRHGRFDLAEDATQEALIAAAHWGMEIRALMHGGGEAG
jgi:predicted RNA polymerase sigma factor